MTCTKIKACLFTIALSLSFASHGWVNSSITHLGAPLKGHSSERFVTAITTAAKIETLAQAQAYLPVAQKVLVSYQRPGEEQFTTLLSCAQDPLQDSHQLLQRIEGLAITRWVYPLFEYQGDPREYVPSDTHISKQDLWHTTMNNYLAWDLELGKAEVVVAITDDGLELEHEDLKDSLWTNPNEIPDNGIDDDQNGLVDDVHGWDFSNGDNSATPISTWYTHGTHVGGIVAAQADNEVGGAGTAPGVKLMPLQFYGGKRRWNAQIILESYAYAADNGAKIINTSYRVDQFVNDPIYLAALEYAYSRGVLIFNSGGNDNKEQPGRVAFDQMLLVVSTLGEKRSGFSNYGEGLDISAPGENIYSTVVFGKYQSMSGTSMAAPNAAGAAALIWSHYPEWNRDQVAAQLLGTARNLDEQNPDFVGKMGAGMIDTYQALTQKLSAPTFQGMRVQQNHLALHLKSVLDAEGLKGEDTWKLESPGPDQEYGTADDQVWSLEFKGSYAIGSNFLNFDLSSLELAPGSYRFVANGTLIKDPFGQHLDGNGDGKAGDSFVFDFTL